MRLSNMNSVNQWSLNARSKKIASYPSFHSKLFLAHNVFLCFSYEFTMKWIKPCAG